MRVIIFILLVGVLTSCTPEEQHYDTYVDSPNTDVIPDTLYKESFGSFTDDKVLRTFLNEYDTASFDNQDVLYGPPYWAKVAAIVIRETHFTPKADNNNNVIFLSDERDFMAKNINVRASQGMFDVRICYRAIQGQMSMSVFRSKDGVNYESEKHFGSEKCKKDGYYQSTENLASYLHGYNYIMIYVNKNSCVFDDLAITSI